MKIALSRLSVRTLEWLAGITVEESLNEKYTVVKDHPLLLNLKKEYELYYGVFGKKAYSGKGKLVAKTDKKRNEAFIGLKFCIYGLTKVEGSSMQTDAVDLYNIFKHFGLDLYRKKYMTKSSLLLKMVEELSKPENQQKIERIHLSEIFGLFSQANIDFENMVLEQISADAKLRGMESASSLRGNLEKALGNYYFVVEAMKKFEGWEHLHAMLNEYVKSARNSRRKRKEKTDKTDETESNS